MSRDPCSRVLTDIRLCSSLIDVNIANADVKVCRAALPRIEVVDNHRSVCNITGGFESGQLDGI